MFSPLLPDGSRAATTGTAPGPDIDPASTMARLADLDVDRRARRAWLSATPSSSSSTAASARRWAWTAPSPCSPVHDGMTFLDLIARTGHVRCAERSTCRLPADVHEQLPHPRRHPRRPGASTPTCAVAGLPLDFLQNQEPKLLADDLTPVDWPADPSARVVPARSRRPLHRARSLRSCSSDCSMRASGYAFVSNADNLGASADPRVAGWFAATGAPFAVEVCRRTPADRKGGHLAVRRSRRPADPARDRPDRAEDEDAFADLEPPPLLQHQQPVDRPAAGATRPRGARRQCSGCR